MGNKQEFVRKRSLRKDREGALEGLPLYMVIMVVIAAVAMVILLSWTQSAQGRDLDRVVIEPDEIDDEVRVTVIVTAYDTSGEKLEGVIVSLEGAGVSNAKKTNSYGTASFTFTPDLLGDNYGEINVMASYTGTLEVKIPGTILVS